MKIAFIGWKGAFDHRHVGGMNAYILRLAKELKRRHIEVGFFYFDEGRDSGEVEGIQYVSFSSWDAIELEALTSFDHTITTYFHRKDRKDWRTKRLKLDHVCHHLLIPTWPDHFMKRHGRMLEIKQMKYTGYHFAFSPRLKILSDKYLLKSELLLPSVPLSFFADNRPVDKSEKLRVSFVGRLDPGKGALRALEFFEYLGDQGHAFKTCIYGYTWDKKESLEIRDKVVASPHVEYVETKFSQSPIEVEEGVRSIYDQSDVLFLPYSSLQSTIDAPLVMLEGMARACLVLSSDVGSLKELYGRSENFVKNLSDDKDLLHCLQRMKEGVDEEKEHVLKQSKKFKIEHIVDTFLKACGGFE